MNATAVMPSFKQKFNNSAHSYSGLQVAKKFKHTAHSKTHQPHPLTIVKPKKLFMKQTQPITYNTNKHKQTQCPITKKATYTRYTIP